MNFKSCITLVILISYNLPITVASSIIYNTVNNYGSKWVYEIGNERCLSFLKPPANIRQSCLNLDNPNLLVFDYSKMMLATLYLKPTPQKILIIGLGGGSLPNALIKLLPSVQIDIVEIDQKIATIAEDYFLFKPTGNVKVFIEDGYKFVQKAKDESYDLIFIDAFTEDYVPPSFLTLDFVSNVNRILTKTGVVSVNGFGKKNKRYQLESELYEKTFTNIINLTSTNRVIIATNEQLPSSDQITQQAAKWKAAFEEIGINTNWLRKKFNLGR
ncbi:MAG: fused MFS/spermidine synthase [Rickettsiaceae bacterium]|nr:fused MFS/spermidine synthase [Rickettsiaceae bacterium]MCP5377693.1 fused MFS/spermidine synthase [Rickettsiaceae bacterium]